MKTFYFSFYLFLFIGLNASVYCKCSATGTVGGASSADSPEALAGTS